MLWGVFFLHIKSRLRVWGNVLYCEKEEKEPQTNPGGRSPGCPKTGEQRERINEASQCQVLVVFGRKSYTCLAFTPVIQDPHAADSSAGADAV